MFRPRTAVAARLRAAAVAMAFFVVRIRRGLRT
jgi:hypothetical protein